MAPIETMNGAGVEPFETLIFVDVDGVLNIGISDPGGAPVMFNKPNVEKCFEMVGAGWRGLSEKVVAAFKRETSGGQGETCADLVADNAAGFSELLAARLAELVGASGERRRVVLSSSWRRTKHQAQVRDLEKSLSKHLGREFTFDASTALDERESCPADRLRTIGNFIADHCASKEKHSDGLRAIGNFSTGTQLRVLVLDDFFVRSTDAWDCAGFTVKSPADAERYLLACATPAPASVSVKVVHTYDEWTEPSGLFVRIGTGLTKEHLRQAHAFLVGGVAAGPVAASFKAAAPARPTMLGSRMFNAKILRHGTRRYPPLRGKAQPRRVCSSCGVPFVRRASGRNASSIKGIARSKRSSAIAVPGPAPSWSLLARDS